MNFFNMMIPGPRASRISLQLRQFSDMFQSDNNIFLRTEND